MKPLYKLSSLSGGDSSRHCLLENDVFPVINKHYPNLIKGVHAALAVVGTLALKDRTKPLSLLFEASSGFGKTAILQMLFPPENPDFKQRKTEIEELIYRSDKFTPKAFVSHAANVKTEDLKKIDLLPKLKNKVLITKELAPIFRGRINELMDNFSVLISVLDGKGLTSDSGMRGSRGYKESIVFNWLGATTPLPASTHRIMSQLGTRLLFFEIPFQEPTEEELIAYAKNGDAGKAELECNLAVTKFIVELFKKYPVGSVEADSISFSDELLNQIVKWARFLVKARSVIKYEDYYEGKPIAASPPEGAWKVINYFKELAMGHALIHERKKTTQDDLDLVAQVAISSVPGHLRPIIKELRNVDSLDSNKGERICGVSRPTIRSYFRELELLEIVELKEGSQKTNESTTVKFAEEYHWLRVKP